MTQRNVHILSGESFMIRHNVDKLRRSLNIQNEQLNITRFLSMPKADELIAACAEVPFMADNRLIVVDDAALLSAKGGTEEAKKIISFIDRMPETTVLVLCAESSDKRRALYKHIKKVGQVKDFKTPKPVDCIQFVMEEAKTLGASIPKKSAEMLVSIVGCDYYTLKNEMAKLAVYAGGKQITSKDVAECASRSLEYNVFEIHGLFVSKQVTKAQRLLDDILISERPEALIGLFARKLRDMYKTKAMLNVRFTPSKIAAQLKVPNFVADILIRECKRFSVDALKDALTALADLDYAIKSGQKDASFALPHTLTRIYQL